MDGIDAAIIESDGETVDRFGAWLSLPYGDAFRARLRACLGRDADDEGLADVARDLTLLHVACVEKLLSKTSINIDKINIIGFHGHTIKHRPEAGVTLQIGDGALLAERTGVPVVDQFRQADVAAGGQGAPLAPLYHAALAATLEKPLGVLNLGGVANLTWIGAENNIVAFDTGPGNALLDDWAAAKSGAAMDIDGAMAAEGVVDEGLLGALLDQPYFELPPPKSLDRNDFSIEPIARLTPGDGAATLVAFTAEAVARGLFHLPTPPTRWLVCGGGRHNPVLMAALRSRLGPRSSPWKRWAGEATRWKRRRLPFSPREVGKAYVSVSPGPPGFRDRPPAAFSTVLYKPIRPPKDFQPRPCRDSFPR